MPARLTLRRVIGTGQGLARVSPRSLSPRSAPPVCLLCSLSRRPPQTYLRARRKAADSRRAESNLGSPEPSAAPQTTPREELAEALDYLQRHAANYVNLSRIQLALRNLGQQPGKESIRVAILGMSDGYGSSARAAKQLLRVLLADPLKLEERWERQLEDHDASQPLIVRIGQEELFGDVAIAYARDSLIQEINVSSPSLNGSDLELLVMGINAPGSAAHGEDMRGFKETVLVPTVDIPTSNTGRHTPVTTPVHKSLLVGEGITGAASVISLPLLQDEDAIAAAINLRQYASEDMSSYPFKRMDVDAANKGLELFRDNVANAMEFEKLWSSSNASAISEWVRAGVLPNDDGATKTPVRALISSILQNTAAAVQEAEAADVSAALSSKASTASVAGLDRALSDWAQSAHQELQEQLDAAFSSRKWRRLSWWKLFWRADDVGMLSSETVAQRFLPEAERGVIFLAGRIREAAGAGAAPYPSPAVPATAQAQVPDAGSRSSSGSAAAAGWPTHIASTRTYLLQRTVPALQALAQRLVAQAAGTAGAAGALGLLAHLSAFSVYEAGAAAALGLAWSLRRLQARWDAARGYWEGEVREEGRKAVRATEASVARVLDEAGAGAEAEARDLDELGRIREAVARAEEALARLK